ncbi:40S ribosomal protein S17 [Asimina triloba]
MFFSLAKPPLLQTLPLHASNPTSKTLLSSPFLNGSASISLPAHTLPKPVSISAKPLSVQALRKMQGRVVCDTNDKTVSVEVIRMAPHPKYKRRVRKKKKFQAHDPENKFRVGDYVELERCRPISKNKAFLAVPIVDKHRPRAAEPVPKELGELPLPLLSEQPPS